MNKVIISCLFVASLATSLIFAEGSGEFQVAHTPTHAESCVASVDQTMARLEAMTNPADPQMVPASTLTVETMKQYIPERSLDVVKDLGASNTSVEDQTALFQQGIDQLAQEGGGYLEVPEGDYYVRSLYLKSHVVVRLDADANIQQLVPHYDTPQPKNLRISTFNIGSEDPNSEKIEYAGVWCENGRAKIYMPHYDLCQLGAVSVNNAEHFVVSNLEIFDNICRRSALQTGGIVLDSKHFIPATDGYIGNIVNHNGRIEYGLIQVQGAKNVHFENLWNEGGVCLRLETGVARIDDNTKGTIDHITARNIYCRNGQLAVMLSPHTNKNGQVQIENVISDGCGFALKIIPGFIPNKVKELYPDMEKGYFSNESYIRNIDANYGEQAQIRKRPEMSETVLSRDATVPSSFQEKFLQGQDLATFLSPESLKYSLGVPSIAPIDYTASYTIAISNVTCSGFTYFNNLANIIDPNLGEVSTPKWFTTTVH